MNSFSVGDKVVVSVPRHSPFVTGDHPGEIVNVARKFGTVRWGRHREEKFVLASGHSPDTGYGPGRAFTVYTPEQFEARQQAAQAREVLQAAGVNLRPSVRWTDEQIARLAAAVSEILRRD